MRFHVDHADEYRVVRVQGSVYQKQSYELFDLWGKDGQGKWGKSLGVHQGSVPNVVLRPHATKVWRAVPVQGGARRSHWDL